MLSFSVFFTACQTFNGLTVINQISSPVVVVFQSQHANDTSKYVVLANENKTIKSTVFTKSIRDKELELKSIIVRVDSTNKYKVLRFSDSFLELNNWRLGIPFPISNSIKYEPWSLAEKVDGLNSHSYYHLVQALYNAGKYTDCMKAVDEVAAFFTTRGASIPRNPPRDGIVQKEIDVREEGLLLLAYLSALKVNEPVKAQYYWNAIKDIDMELINYLQNNDYEISR